MSCYNNYMKQYYNNVDLKISVKNAARFNMSRENILS